MDSAELGNNGRGTTFAGTEDSRSDAIGRDGREINLSRSFDASKISRGLAQAEADGRTEDAEAMRFFDNARGKEVSRSGHIYEEGKKPSSLDYDRGIKNLFKSGDRRLFKDYENQRYVLETWNGSEWVSENETQSDVRLSRKTKIFLTEA